MTGEISKERAAFLARDYSRGFVQYCQLEADAVRRGFFQSRVTIESHHRQQDGFIHAGVMATMADHTAGYAAFSTVSEEFQILTIEFKVNLLAPARVDVAEIMAAQGFDSVTVDMQHGALDYSDLLPMLQAMRASGATLLARVPWLDPAHVMKALDAGADGIICPVSIPGRLALRVPGHRAGMASG